MQRLAVLMAVVALAGCVEPMPGGPWPVERPDGWDATPEMTAVSGGRYHSADQHLVADGPSGVPVPAGCAAYQDGVRKGWDTCRVEADQRPDAAGSPAGVGWTVMASWNGRGEDLIEQERDESRRTVVAFDADGNPVAHLPRAVAFDVE